MLNEINLNCDENAPPVFDSVISPPVFNNFKWFIDYTLQGDKCTFFFQPGLI